MLNFAVGPVMMDEQTLEISSHQIPYFRTEEFSMVVKKCEENFKQLVGAGEKFSTVFMTGSGTASMEAVIMNVLSNNDRALVVNGGSFGERFCKICSLHSIDYTAIFCQPGKTLIEQQLAEIDGSKYTAFIVNLCETSTGVLYDIELISRFCNKYNLLLIVDAVSAFLCDLFEMKKNGIDVVITGSQKALGLAPGLSVMCFSERALERINNNNVRSIYFNLKDYLADGKRGQTPFTPAVGIILQFFEKTNRIIQNGGIMAAIDNAKIKADYFRRKIKDLSLKLFADHPSNSVTALSVQSNINAYEIFLTLKDVYNIYICPNGGELKNRVFRIGHMGNITFSDYDNLIAALEKVI